MTLGELAAYCAEYPADWRVLVQGPTGLQELCAVQRRTLLGVPVVVLELRPLQAAALRHRGIVRSPLLEEKRDGRE